MKQKRVYKRSKQERATDELASLPMGSVPQIEQSFNMAAKRHNNKKRRNHHRRSSQSSATTTSSNEGSPVELERKLSSHRRSLTHVGALSIRTELDTNPPVAIAGLILDKPLDPESLKRIVTEKLLNNTEQFYRLSSRIDDELNFFVSVDVDVNEHVICTQLNGQTDAENFDEEAALRDLISECMTKSFSIEKPMWEILLVDGYSKGQIMLFRVHHVIGDGTSIALICQTLCDGFTTEKMLNNLKKEREEAAGKEQANLIGRLKQYPVLKQVYMLFFGVFLILGCLRTLYKWFIETLVGGLDPPTLLNRYRNNKIPKTSSSEELPIIAGGKKRVAYSSNKITVADAKAIGKPFGATINDVLLCCLAGAIDRYTESKGEAVSRCNVRVGIPVNIRTRLEDFVTPSNKFGFMICKLPLGMKEQEQRLTWIKKDTSWNKKLPESFFSNFVNFAIGKVTPVWLLKEFFKTMSKYQSLIVSNVQAVSEECAIEGSVINSILPFTPLPWGIGLGLMILSYNGTVNIALTTDENLIPDPETIIEYILDEYNSLKEKIMKPNVEPSSAKKDSIQKEAPPLRKRTRFAATNA